MWFQGSLVKRVVLALSIIILLPLLGFGLYTARQEKEYALLTKRDELYRLASLIELRISEDFDVLWADAGLNTSREEQALLLNQRMQPIIDQIRSVYPYYGIGIVSSDLQLRIAMSPGYIQEWLQDSPPEEIEFSQYQLGKIQTFQANSANWNKERVMVVTIPIVHGNKHVGYVWANTKLEDIHLTYQQSIRQWVIFSSSLWLLIMLMIRFFLNQFNLSISQLTSHLLRPTDDKKPLTELPQLVPVLKTMAAIRNSYHQELKALKRVIDACPVAAVVVDQQGVITAHNERYADFLQRMIPSGQALIGMSEQQIMEKFGVPETDGVFARILQGESKVEMHQKLQDAEFITYGMPIIDKETNQLQGAVIVVTDITDREKLRREMERLDKLRVIGEVAASVAHEVRNPLTVVRGNLQLMALKTEDNQRYLHMIEELDRANNIIEDFISLAQSRTVVKTFCNMNQIVTTLQPELCSHLLGGTCRVDLQLTANLPYVFVSSKEIKQLIIHLCRNASDAMPSGGQLIISTKRAGHCVELQIKDTGCGIPQAVMEKVTEPFYTTKRNGSGLGLVICHSIVEQNNAELRIDSVEGVGTTVTVKFHLTKPLHSACVTPKSAIS